MCSILKDGHSPRCPQGNGIISASPEDAGKFGSQDLQVHHPGRKLPTSWSHSLPVGAVTLTCRTAQAQRTSGTLLLLRFSPRLGPQLSLNSGFRWRSILYCQWNLWLLHVPFQRRLTTLSLPLCFPRLTIYSQLWASTSIFLIITECFHRYRIWKRCPIENPLFSRFLKCFSLTFIMNSWEFLFCLKEKDCQWNLTCD